MIVNVMAILFKFLDRQLLVFLCQTVHTKYIESGYFHQCIDTYSKLIKLDNFAS